MVNSFIRMEDKLDKLTEICIDNRRHLKNINGTLLTHQKSIECHRKKIYNLEGDIKFYKGIGIAGMTLIGIFFTILNLFIL